MQVNYNLFCSVSHLFDPPPHAYTDAFTHSECVHTITSTIKCHHSFRVAECVFFCPSHYAQINILSAVVTSGKWMTMFRRCVFRVCMQPLKPLPLPAGGTHKLAWLPRQLPEGLRVVVSTLEGLTLDSLRNHASPAQEVAVNPLNETTRKCMAEQLLQTYNKRLDAEQVGSNKS